MILIIVESPTKAKTIQKFLGKDYKILSSYGHIRDLPKSKLGIEPENNFKINYIVPMKAKKNANLLKKEAKKVDSVILATDQDREGEAIAYHLAFLLELKDKPQRIVFHEITKEAITKALKNPQPINLKLVEAQQARRVLDRIVGYKLSPFLWKKITRGLSAGRVQSVALRLVVEREREREKFKAEEYWQVEVELKKDDIKFKSLLIKEDNKPIDKLAIKNEKEAKTILKELEKAQYQISKIEKKEAKRNPFPPFTTSTLQQTAWHHHRFSSKQTMSLAQKLYEKGLITYHRTDSFNLSDVALFSAKEYISKNYGQEYWAGYFKKYKTKRKGAQEAHEAIRPVYPEKEPDSLNLEKNQEKLYDLIWRRFLASQMNQAIFDSTAIEIKANNYTFKTTGQILKFSGFLKVYPTKYKETDLPSLEEKEILKLIELLPSQHFTEPPARFNEATLIKVLEEKEIGRPSTYAPILSNIQEKNYIEKDEQKRFQPTEIGLVLSDTLTKHFPKIVDINFTAEMEKDLDKIAEGKKDYLKLLQEFYQPFEKKLKEKYDTVSKAEIAEKPTDKICPQCGSPLLLKLGRYGRFYACSAFPKCKYAAPLEENKLNVKCPKCKEGDIVEKRTKKHKIFYACNRYPKCGFALWDKPTGKLCPKCKSLLVKTKRKQIKCSNKECDYIEK